MGDLVTAWAQEHVPTTAQSAPEQTLSPQIFTQLRRSDLCGSTHYAYNSVSSHIGEHFLPPRFAGMLRDIPLHLRGSLLIILPPLIELAVTSYDLSARTQADAYAVAVRASTAVLVVAETLRRSVDGSWVFTSGDSIEQPTNRDDQELFRAVLSATATMMHLPDTLRVRTAYADVNPEIGNSLLMDSGLVGGGIFPVAELLEQNAPQENLVTDGKAPQSDILNTILLVYKQIQKEARFEPYANIAFGAASWEISNDDAFQNIKELRALLEKSGYKVKIGPIKTYSGKATCYIIPFNSETRIGEYLFGLQKIQNEAAALGVNLAFSVGNKPITLFGPKEFGGPNANYLSRLAYSGIGRLVIDREYRDRLLEEGYIILPPISSQFMSFKGIEGIVELYCLDGTVVEKSALSHELDQITSENAVINLLRDKLDKSLMDNEKIFIEKILQNVARYSLSEKRLEHYKIHTLAILSMVERRIDIGEIISNISEVALRYGFARDLLTPEFSGNEDLVDSMNILSCLVFGRDYSCRLIILETLGINSSSIEKLVKLGLIENNRESEVYTINPNPVLVHWIYTHLSNKYKSEIHTMIAFALQMENSWGECLNESNFMRVRSYLLHLRAGQHNESRIRPDSKSIKLAIKYMIDQRLFSEFISTFSNLIPYLEDPEKLTVKRVFNDDQDTNAKPKEKIFRDEEIFEMKLYLIYSLLKTDRKTQALKLIGDLQNEFDELLIENKRNATRLKNLRILTQGFPIDNQMEILIRSLQPEDSDFVLLLEFISENYGNQYQDLILEKIQSITETQCEDLIAKSTTAKKLEMIDNPYLKVCVLRMLKKEAELIDYSRDTIVLAALDDLMSSTDLYLQIQGQALNSIITSQCLSEQEYLNVYIKLLTHGDFETARLLPKPKPVQLEYQIGEIPVTATFTV